MSDGISTSLSDGNGAHKVPRDAVAKESVPKNDTALVNERLLEAAQAPMSTSTNSMDWAQHNVVDPLVNSAVIDTWNIGVNLANKVTHKSQFQPAKEWAKDKAEFGTKEYWAQNIFSGVGAVVPYALAAFGAGKLIRGIAGNPELTGWHNTLMNSTAQVSGAACLDAARPLQKGETPWNNAKGSAVTFSLMESGNFLAGRWNPEIKIGNEILSRIVTTGAKHSVRIAGFATTGAISAPLGQLASGRCGITDYDELTKSAITGGAMSTILPYMHETMPWSKSSNQAKQESSFTLSTLPKAVLNQLSRPLSAIADSFEIDAKYNQASQWREEQASLRSLGKGTTVLDGGNHTMFLPKSKSDKRDLWQAQAALLGFNGKYVPECVHKWETKHTDANKEEIFRAKQELNSHGESPEQAMVNALQTNRIIGIGENHKAINPLREHAEQLMPLLKQAGATHVAVEWSKQEDLDKFWETGSFPHKLLEEGGNATYVKMLNAARANGLELVAVDATRTEIGNLKEQLVTLPDEYSPWLDTKELPPKCELPEERQEREERESDNELQGRNKIMANKIVQILKDDPNNKVVFWVGAEHLAVHHDASPSKYSSAAEHLIDAGHAVATFVAQTEAKYDSAPYIFCESLKEPVAIATNKTDALRQIAIRSKSTAYDGTNYKLGNWDHAIFYPAQVNFNYGAGEKIVYPKHAKAATIAGT